MVMREDLARKAKFLSIFANRRVVGRALKDVNLPRLMFRSWLAADPIFHQEFLDACEDIDDELLELALIEAGVLRRKRGGEKKIDKTILLSLIKNHARLRVKGVEDSGNATIIINIKGADPAALLMGVGQKAKGPEIPVGLTDAQAKMLTGPEASA